MHWTYSPFAIPIAAFAMVLGIVIVANVYNYHVRKLKSEERLAAIAKGIPLPVDLEDPPRQSMEASARRDSRGMRTGGIVCIAVGIGLALFSFSMARIVDERDVLSVAAAGLIPLAIGVGLLIDYALRNRTFKNESE